MFHLVNYFVCSGSDTPNQVEVEARNIRVTISGEKLKGASFRITAENEENIIPVRVHKSSMHYFLQLYAGVGIRRYYQIYLFLILCN